MYIFEAKYFRSGNDGASDREELVSLELIAR